MVIYRSRHNNSWLGCGPIHLASRHASDSQISQPSSESLGDAEASGGSEEFQDEQMVKCTAIRGDAGPQDVVSVLCHYYGVPK